MKYSKRTYTYIFATWLGDVGAKERKADRRWVRNEMCQVQYYNCKQQNRKQAVLEQIGVRKQKKKQAAKYKSSLLIDARLFTKLTLEGPPFSFFGNQHSYTPHITQQQKQNNNITSKRKKERKNEDKKAKIGNTFDEEKDGPLYTIHTTYRHVHTYLINRKIENKQKMSNAI